MKDQIRGCVKINVTGRELYRFINKLHSGRIVCTGQCVKNDTFFGEIYSHDLKKVRELAEECGVSLSFFEYETIRSKLRRFRKRIGIAAGIVIIIFSMMYFSSVVVTIDIQGNSTVSDEVILAALEESGLKKGTPFRDINYQLCENQLRVKVDGIAWAGMHRTGNRIVVEVTEPVPVPEKAAGRLPCNIVSAHDATITGAVVNDGMLMHLIGENVPAGGVLISGVVTDEQGRTSYCHALGRITGIYEETAVFEEPFAEESEIYTGRSSVKRSLELFSLEVPLPFGGEKYAHSTSDSFDSELKLFGKELPLGVRKEVTYEKKVRQTVRSAEQVDELLCERIYLYEKNFIPEDTVIKERHVKRTMSESSMMYTVNYVLEGEIGKESEIYIK
ncbi:MAG: sporulation protein YqfD [Ruminococcus sp.]|nr:sporulation protein YqfD [Ruminococcus sp.]